MVTMAIIRGFHDTEAIKSASAMSHTAILKVAPPPWHRLIALLVF